MKLSEIKAGQEYALIAPNARYKSRATKVMFTKQQLEKGVNSYSKKIKCLVWRQLWGADADWDWSEVTLAQVREPWADFEEKREAEQKVAEERHKRNQERAKLEAVETQLLREFLTDNRQKLEEVLGVPVYSYCLKPSTAIKFDLAQLKALLERLAND